ncbi:MAG: OsmC family protein [Bacteroidota bacterium]|nr:OsmC family protein [Bacteroidota bacterium]
MSSHKTVTKYILGMAFETEVAGHKIILDNSPEDLGPSPKPLLLSALAACSGMDIVPILQKMKVEFSDLSIDVEGELSEDYPKIYHTIKIIYYIHLNPENFEKMERAVKLSLEKYCGVYAMLVKAADISYEIKIV